VIAASAWSRVTNFTKVMGLVFNMDKMVGGAFDKGLSGLKALAEKL